ncbi:TPA: hypothetical protein DCF80_02435 [Candidatus Saccharibacteria bacterium]|nr:hypothetical protein [Candidatus Saccharibacteria bacterium]HRK41057.1 hypothetical protein [Candidatus Saccharibacteria bacterium]
MLTLEQAASGERTYRAREAVRRPLGSTSLIAFVGPTAAGKNFLMEQSELPIVGTVTTREKRPTDGPGYRYLSHDEVLARIEVGQLVQYAVHPPNVYGSELEDYALDAPNAADIYYHAVYALENKGFENVRAVSVLTPPEQWMSQLFERFEGMEIGKIFGRLDEARHSLRWIRSQHLGNRATNRLVVINQTDNVVSNIDKIHSFADGKFVPPPSDEATASAIDAMERAIGTMYSRIT